MGKRVTTTLFCDMDENQENPAAYVDVPIIYDGFSYEIDLSLEFKEKLDEALRPFLARARRIGKNGKPARPVMPPEMFRQNESSSSNGHHESDSPAPAPELDLDLDLMNAIVRPGERWWPRREGDTPEMDKARRSLRLDVVRPWARTEGGWGDTMGERGAMPDEVFLEWEAKVWAKDASRSNPS